MRIAKERHRDAADPEPDGSLDWVYEYDSYTFEGAGAVLRFRRYRDEPSTAYVYLPSTWSSLVPIASALLAPAIGHLRAEEGITDLRAYHVESGGYKPWGIAVKSAVAAAKISAEDAGVLLAAVASVLET
jgi:hypothetical protein